MGAYLDHQIRPLMSGQYFIPDNDHEAVSDECMVVTAGEALALMDCVILQSDGKFDQCDADVEVETKGLCGIVLSSNAGTLADADTFYVVFRGVIRDDTWDWAPSAKLFIGDTAGQLVSTAPSGGGQFVRCVGHAITADVIMFNPDCTVDEVPA